jgi:DNA-binding YbaB/EbfC family protein
MQEKMAAAQAQLDEVEVTGESGAGLVTLVMTAKGDLKKVNIDKGLMDPEEPEILEDLLMAAHNDARRKAEEKQQEILREAAGGLQLPPGMSMPF